MKTRLRIILTIVLSLAVLVVAGYTARWMATHVKKAEETRPEMVVPQVLAPPLAPRINEHVRITGLGSARPHIRLKIIPQVTGTVIEKAPGFLSGKYVSKGQVLLRIDPTDYLLAVESAEKQVELLNAQLARLNQEEKNLAESEKIEAERRDVAKRKVSRFLQLLESGAASDDELDQVREALLARRAQLQNITNQLALIGPRRSELQAEVAAAQVELRQARTNLQRCTILSPVTGRVLSCLMEVGERVLAGANCGELFGTEIMEVPVSVAAGDLQWLDRELIDLSGQGRRLPSQRSIRAEVLWLGAAAGRPVRWPGYLERIEAGLEAETRTATLIVRVVNPPPGDDGKPMLDVNMFCKVTVLGKKLPKVYILPRSAILADGSVYVVEDGRLRKRQVRLSRLAGEEAMILPGGGLNDGDRVVVGPIAKPVVGMVVEALDSPRDKQTEEPPTPGPDEPAAKAPPKQAEQQRSP
ncbi:MAG: biotin/lipoyl-binding protein [Anaerolineaceae bacterium]|nr:biotin/lipoyl-binding protein [Anaerolineaceae bacterium]